MPDPEPLRLVLTTWKIKESMGESARANNRGASTIGRKRLCARSVALADLTLPTALIQDS